ncbi:ATP-binding protein [Acidicapsa acidisoli]|uniref:ATP-binding protein n=1 Tax=Acidicapsa acidisoli TaxID=1615681 RepID=UPI0021E010E0|nr:ATP-binding protein [Acidicapsa acidisoli]
MASSQHAEFLQTLQEAKLRRNRPVNEPSSEVPFSVHTHDLRRLKLNLKLYTPFLQLAPERGSLSTTELVTKLIEYSKGINGPMAYLTDRPVSSDLASDELRRRSIAILDSETIRDFVEARDNTTKYRVLGSALAKSLGYLTLSPYLPGSTVSGSGFFGREKILGHILTGKTLRNTTIVGNRRIGKTSCMQEIKDRLNDLYDAKTLCIAELYGSKCRSTWDAVYAIFDQIGVRIPKNLAKYGAIAPRFVLRMPQLLHNFAKQNQVQIVIFIDEYDEFLARDAENGYEFTHLLRETVIERSGCYVVIAGFRYLMRERTLHKSPLYNFAPEQQLGPLLQKESLEMISEPLLRMGIDIPPDLQGTIYKETRGQPELIQMYCSAVIEAFEEKKRPPSPAELLHTVNGSPEFRRTVLQAFFSNSTPTEQIICLEMMKRIGHQDPKSFEFRIDDIEQVLSAYGYGISNVMIELLLTNLTTGSFVEEGPSGVYRFATPQLARFCQKENLDTLLTRAKKQLGPRVPTPDELARESGIAYSAVRP